MLHTLPLLRALILAALVLASGCAAKRSLMITSDPEGAAVRLDEKIIGTTPITVDFHHYGIRRITLYKDGYLTTTRRVDVDAPWYGLFPMDYVSEVFLPIGWNDRHRVHFTLSPGTPVEMRPDLRSVLDRAETLRRAGPDGPSNLPPIITEQTQRIVEPEPEPEPEGPRRP